MSFFIPSIVSSSSKAKSNFWTLVDHLFYARSQSEGTNLVANRLVRRVMPTNKVRVFERILAGYAPRGVEAEHSSEEVDCLKIRLRVKLLEWNARLDWQRANVFLGLRSAQLYRRLRKEGYTYTRRANASERVLRWRTEAVEDLRQLVSVTVRNLVESRYVRFRAYSFPGKMGLPSKNSAKMQPTDQMST